VNQQQIEAMLRLLLGAGGPLAALLLAYGVPSDKLNLWVNLAIAIIPPIGAGVWGILANTQKRSIADAAAIPGVIKIKVSDNATGGAAQAANDANIPNVKRASE
jgi:hypothetical protein